jgi:hypothetical protein
MLRHYLELPRCDETALEQWWRGEARFGEIPPPQDMPPTVLHGEQTMAWQEVLEIQRAKAPQAIEDGGHAAIGDILNDDLAACENGITRDQHPGPAKFDQKGTVILTVAGCLQHGDGCVANLHSGPVTKNVVDRRSPPAIVRRINAEVTRAIEADPALVMRRHAVCRLAPRMDSDARQLLAQGRRAAGMVGVGMRQKDVPQLSGVQAAGLNFGKNGWHVAPRTTIKQGESVTGVNQPDVAIERVRQGDAGRATGNEMDCFCNFHMLSMILSQAAVLKLAGCHPQASFAEPLDSPLGGFQLLGIMPSHAEAPRPR